MYVDLHIHSCLSPCGDYDMTPNDIISMAKIKGLDMISITDHNSCENLKSIKNKDFGELIVVPGLEVTTSEEIHVLCYFYDFDTAIEFSDMLYDRILDFKNKNNAFGKQIVVDENDNIIKIEEKLLVSACNMSIFEVVKKCKEYGGVCVPAHINKQYNSILMSLSCLPEECEFSSVEIHKNSKMPDIDLSKYNILYSSDSHCLQNIYEKEFSIELEEKSIKCLLNYLDKKKDPKS